jgi:hypothetical protein
MNLRNERSNIGKKPACPAAVFVQSKGIYIVSSFRHKGETLF